LPKKVDGFGLAIPKMRVNTCCYIPNEFVKAVSKIRINWYQRERLNNGGEEDSAMLERKIPCVLLLGTLIYLFWYKI